MARIRQIKPEFFRHEELYALEKHCALPVRVAFSGLWTVCDRNGRFRWRPRTLKLDILPYDDIDFDSVLSALESKGFVVSYLVDGEKYGYIPTWDKHQNPHVKEQASTIPAPGKTGSCTADSGLRNTDTDSGSRKPGAKWSDDDIAIVVCQALMFSGLKHPRWVAEAIPNVRKRTNLKDPEAVANFLIDRWQLYQSLPIKAKFGFQNWLAEGHYADDYEQTGVGGSIDRAVAKANEGLANQADW